MSTAGTTTKRPFDDDPSDHVLDDLAVAAQFAMAQPPPNIHNDANEIDLASDDGSLASNDQDPLDASDEKKVEDEVGGESDEDEDQTAQNQALQKLLVGLDSDGEDDGVPLERKKALSKNEVDAYDSTMNELQQRLNWNPEIGNVQLPVDANSWAIAGHIQQHVVSERTLVILSQTDGALLEAGTLLALRLDAEIMFNEKRLPKQIPLGRILEVFGPVSRPLYSLRLTGFDESSGKSNEDENNSSEPLQDPWGTEGLFTGYLKQNPHLPVHYLHHGTTLTTKILDPAEVYKTSGRGCDASNLYDEEIDQKDMEYSDDEQERREKAGRKGNRHRQHASRSGGSTMIPVGFHAGRPAAHAPPLHQFPPSSGRPATTNYTGQSATATDQGDDSDTEYYDFS